MTKRLRGKTLLAAVALVGLVIVFVGVGRVVDLNEILATDRFAVYLKEAGPLAPLILIGTMALAVVVSPIPSLPLDLAAGAAFGPVLGTTYAVVGAGIGAIISFLIARVLGRELIFRILRTDVVFCPKCSDHHLVILLLLARLLPIFSFDIISYGAGLTNMSLRVFTMATVVGMIPPTFALTYLGSSVTSAQWPLILLGVLMVAFFLAAPRLVLRYPSAWWARLLLAASPSTRPPTKPQGGPAPSLSPSRPCASCGACMP